MDLKLGAKESTQNSVREKNRSCLSALVLTRPCLYATNPFLKPPSYFSRRRIIRYPWLKDDSLGPRPDRYHGLLHPPS